MPCIRSALEQQTRQTSHVAFRTLTVAMQVVVYAPPLKRDCDGLVPKLLSNVAIGVCSAITKQHVSLPELREASVKIEQFHIILHV